MCDFAAGTGPAGLAGLFLNQSKVVLNDRDSTIVDYTRARLRGYLSSLQQAPHWTNYQVPGSNPFADIAWNGACPYTPCLVAVGAFKKTGTLYPTDNDLFSGMTMHQIAEQNGCRVDEQAGTLSVVADFAKGDQFPLFGIYSTSRRSPTSSDKGIMMVELRGLVAKKATQVPTPLYLKPSATCPFKYLRKPSAGEMTNCRVVENTCDWFWPNKVCLELTTPIEATSAHPVELLCTYDTCTQAIAPAKYNATPGRKRKRKHTPNLVDDLNDTPNLVDNDFPNLLDDINDFSGEATRSSESDAAADDEGVTGESRSTELDTAADVDNATGATDVETLTSVLTPGPTRAARAERRRASRNPLDPSPTDLFAEEE